MLDHVMSFLDFVVVLSPFMKLMYKNHGAVEEESMSKSLS